MIVECTKNNYITSPLSKDEVEKLREQQRKWTEAEKRWSLQFAILVITIPLCVLGALGTWTTLGIGMVVGLFVYLWFKMQIPKWLDNRYPCRVVIDGEEVVKPFCNGLVAVPLNTVNKNSAVLRKELARLERPALKFEVELVRSATEIKN